MTCMTAKLSTRKIKHAPTPVDDIVRLVLAYARNVRSDARWSRATLPAFSSVSRRPHSLKSFCQRGSLRTDFAFCFVRVNLLLRRARWSSSSSSSLLRAPASRCDISVGVVTSGLAPNGMGLGLRLWLWFWLWLWLWLRLGLGFGLCSRGVRMMRVGIAAHAAEALVAGAIAGTLGQGRMPSRLRESRCVWRECVNAFP